MYRLLLQSGREVRQGRRLQLLWLLQVEMTPLKRHLQIVGAVAAVLLGLFAAFIVWRPLRPPLPEIDLPKPTCQEEREFCNDDCQDDELGAPCSECCKLGKAVCDQGGDFVAYHIRCMRQVYPERPPGREIEGRQECNQPMRDCYEVCIKRDKVQTCLHCCDRQRKLCDKKKAYDFDTCKSAL
jgi:hypothetical protein